MPKPVKKKAATKKSTTPKRPSSDPVTRAKQMMDEHLAKMAMSQPPWAKDLGEAKIEVVDSDVVVAERPLTPEELRTFEGMYRARMSALGKKGGQVSGGSGSVCISTGRVMQSDLW